MLRCRVCRRDGAFPRFCGMSALPLGFWLLRGFVILTWAIAMVGISAGVISAWSTGEWGRTFGIGLVLLWLTAVGCLVMLSFRSDALRVAPRA